MDARLLVCGLAALLLAGLTTGCSEEVGSSNDRQIDFHPLERDSRLITEGEDPGPPVDLEQNPEYRQIIEGFRANADVLFARQDIAKRLDQIEQVFLGTGRYLELVAIYQDVVAERGLKNPAATRLAWAYVRLGQEKQARRLLDRLLEVQPQNPEVYFIDGSFWFNRARQSQTAAARTILAWRRVVELDPNFEGYRKIGAADLKRQTRQLQSQLPKPAEQIVQAAEAEDKGQATGADEGGAPAVDQMPGGEQAEQPAAEEGESDAGRKPVAEADAGTAQEQTAPAPAEPDAGRADAGPTADQPQRTPTPILLTRADLALGQGKLDRATSLFQKVLDRDSDNLDVRIGLVRVERQRTPDDPKVAEKVRQLAEADNLTASQAYDLGLFAKVKLGDDPLARQLWKKVRELDPDYADRLGLD